MSSATNVKIGDSSTAQIQLVGFLVLIFVLIQLLIVVISDDVHFAIGTILFLIACSSLLNYVAVSVPLNKGYLLLNDISREKRAIFEGFNFKLPWEGIEYEEDLHTEMGCDIVEDFPTTDGSVAVKASVMLKADVSGEDEEERSKKMVICASHAKEARQNMAKDSTKVAIREFLIELSTDEAVKVKTAGILTKDTYSILEEDLAIKIVKSVVKDIDYNEETQKANNASFKAKAMGKILDVLVEKGWTKEEAKVLAPFMDKDINFKKEFLEFNANGNLNINGLNLSPEVMSLIHKFLKNRKS